jgi:hypothetical protein
MLRWRQDKPVAEADTLETLRELLPQTTRPITGPAVNAIEPEAAELDSNPADEMAVNEPDVSV